MTTEKQTVAIPDQEQEFDTKGLFLAFLSHWKWFAISVAVCITAAFLYVKSVVPTYKVEASTYLSDNAQTNSAAFSLNASDPLMGFKDMLDETELEVMKSRNTMVRIVDSLDLCYAYALEGSFRPTPLYRNAPVTAQMDSLALARLKTPITITVKPAGDGKVDIKAETEYNGVKEKKALSDATLPATLELAAGTVTLSRDNLISTFDKTEKITIVSPRDRAVAISKNLTIDFLNKNSKNVVHIELLDAIPQRAADIIEALLAFYNQDIVAEKNQSAIQTEAFILDRLAMINGELKDVESRLQAYRQAHNISDLQAQSQLNLTQQSSYENQLAQIDAELSFFDEIERLINTGDNHTTLPTIVSQPALTTIIENYNHKVNQFNRTFAGSTADNPLVVSMRTELENDRARIMQSMAAARRNIQTQRANIRQLDRAAGAELASQPTVDRGLQEIFREQQVKVNIYTFLLQRREEIALQKTMATNSARLIDDPISDLPVAPRKALILAAALILGLAIPAIVIFVRRTLFPSFSSQDDLKRLTDIPVIGELCRIPKEDHTEIVVEPKSDAPITELFRLLRNNISFTRQGADSRVILITSAVSGEGKTFVASNLAMTYALADKKVLAIGMDLRRPVLPRVFKIPNNAGASTFLAGKETDLSKLVVQSKQNPNLWVLPAGPVPPNPNELLMSDNMARLIDQARQMFDYVIIDSAPIGLVSDSYLIARHSDLQIFVTRADRTSPSAITLLHEAVREGKFKAIYLVLNDVDITSTAYSYQRYGHYGYSKRRYGYGYGYGYSKQDKK